MKLALQTSNWLETRACAPAYSGWILAIIALCFFGAATNTMAGWLYVISGIIVALLILGAILPIQTLKKIQINRRPILPVSAGEQLAIELVIKNLASQPKHLLAVEDMLPKSLGKPGRKSIETIAPGQVYSYLHYYPTIQRGIYRWQEVQLKTAAPLGLFWCRRSWQVKGKAIVYPQILPLNKCFSIDKITQADSFSFSREQQLQAASEGITRSLRPYRRGDATRLIHWRSSARYGELRVRELETVTGGGKQITICLDSASQWQSEAFETAVVAAASLYYYAWQRQFNVKLWSARKGLVTDKQGVLETLAIINHTELANFTKPSKEPLLWLTSNHSEFNNLPKGSRWLLFSNSPSEIKLVVNPGITGQVIDLEKSLRRQLEN